MKAKPTATFFHNEWTSFGKPGTSGTPSSATRSNDEGTVTFNFLNSSSDGKLKPGSYSDLLIIRTNADSYSAGNLSFSDNGGSSAQLGGFGASPEPASMV